MCNLCKTQEGVKDSAEVDREKDTIQTKVSGRQGMFYRCAQQRSTRLTDFPEEKGLAWEAQTHLWCFRGVWAAKSFVRKTKVGVSLA